MIHVMKTLGAAAAALALAAGAPAQTARDIRGASPYDVLRDEPPPKLVVDPPFPKLLEQGIFQAQYRVENLRIVPVFNQAAIEVTPRIGHLHIIVDDLPWWWADSSDNNTVDIANLPPGPHKVTIRLVNPNHEPFPGQEVVLRFTVPQRSGQSH